MITPFSFVTLSARIITIAGLMMIARLMMIAGLMMRPFFFTCLFPPVMVFEWQAFQEIGLALLFLL